MAVYRHRSSWMYDFVKNARRYREGGYRTRQEAVEAEAKARTTARKINMDFLRLCTSRLEDLETRRSKGHFERNKLLFEKLVSKWGTLSEVTITDVEEFLKETAQDSKDKANRYLTLIKALFRHGIKRRLVDYDPTVGIEPYGIERARKYIPPAEDVENVLSIAPQEFKEYLITILHTAGRMREINKLRWDDINFEENYLILKTRKAKNSDLMERKIPLTDTLREILLKKERIGDYVFTNKSSGSYFDNRIKMIRNLCKLAKVKKFTFHNLRHFSASKLANLGVALTDIQEILGHTRPTTTDNYLQALKGSVRDAIKKLE